MTEERRYYSAPAEVEMQQGQTRIVGYAAVFDTLSKVLTTRDGRSFRERIKPGAFLRSLIARKDVLARFEHETILGRVGNGTLRLTEDNRGLRYEIDLPNTTLGRDLAELIRRRDVPYSSFAFQVIAGGDTWKREDGQLIRTLLNVELLDVAPVTQPAYPDTEAALRSLKAAGLAN